MECTSLGCNKVWNIQVGPAGLPACSQGYCPLRQWAAYMGGEPYQGIPKDDIDMGPSDKGAFASKRSVFHHPPEKHLGERITSTCIGNSVDSFHDDIGTINDYVLGGQNATTTVSWNGGSKALKTGQTVGQMHSEMEAIKYMLNNGHWMMINGEIFTSAGRGVSPQEFKTDEMHCGWCTLFLHALGLPLGKPSSGNFNQACNLLYPLPSQVKNSPHIMFKFIFGGQEETVKAERILNLKTVFDKFLTIPCDQWFVKDFSGLCIASNDTTVTFVDPSQLDPQACVLTWDHLFSVNGGDLVEKIWKSIYAGIYKQLS